MGDIPCIAHLSEVADDRTASICELVQVLLAEEHGASLLQARDNIRVAGGNAILENRTGSGGAHRLRVDDVLEPKRNPMQGPAPPAGVNLSFRGARLLESRVSRDRDKSFQYWIQPFDSRKAVGGDLHRRRGVVPEHLGQFK